MSKDFSDMTLEQAIAWTQDKCKFHDVRKRMAGRAVAFLLLQALTELSLYTEQLETELKTLKGE